MTAPPDRDARARTVAGRERSLLVEASAGTGKTHAIIDVVEEVCVRREPRLPLTRVAAVTFTEKAAGELQDRLRGRLASIAADEAESPAARAAAAESLREIDRAQVGTIHAFCSALLRERPIEAHLVPAFTLLMPEASTALAAAVWEEWWRAEAADRPDGPLGRALRAGMKLVGGQEETTISSLAADLYEKRTRVEDAVFPEATAEAVRAEARTLRARAEALRREAAEAGNPAADALAAVVGWLDGLPDDLEAVLTAAELAPAVHFKPRWRTDAIERFREKEYKPFVASLLEAQRWPVLVDLLHRLVDDPGGYLPTIERRKRRESLLDFDDLLLRTRDLLRRSGAARRHFRERYALIVVDEFQDTDPIQMEIVLRLAHEEGGAPEWTTLVPSPGRLLLVGDPKQSIYRFRRADLESYALVRDLLGADREIFVANRRSVAPILDWVNAVFGAAMAPPVAAYESSYSPIEPWDARPAPPEKRVLYLDPPETWRTDEGGWRRAEADAIAAFLADAIATEKLRLEEGRAARAGDVAVLVRTNESVGLVQEALSRVGLDAVVEGGLDFFRREEPAAVLAALRAIDNPHDPVALYAALKSFLFAVSDEDLFLARAAGAAFDYRRASLAEEPLRSALELFGRLHEQRDGRPASETMLDLYAATGAVVKARARPIGGLQARANLHQLVSLARELETSAPTFGDVVRGLASIQNTEASEPRAFEESTDAVRILTVHKAKGLEFPVVVLAGFGALPRPAGEGLRVPRRAGLWGATIKLPGGGVATPGFESVRRADDERDAAETRRLLYVGATRAQEWFVLSRWRKIADTRKGVSDAFDRSAHAMLGPVAVPEALAPLVARVTPEPARPRRARPPRRADAAAAAALREEISAVARRSERARATARASLRRAAVDVAGDDRPVREQTPAAEPDVAVRIGRAVHHAMETIVNGGPPEGAIARAAAEWELGPALRGEVETMVRTLLAAPLLSPASRRLAEFPILFRSPDDGALVEGKIDLLIEGDGGWTIVDYKTDRLDRFRDVGAVRAHFEAYRPQLREYETALSLLGVHVAGSCILSARTGEAFPFSRP